MSLSEFFYVILIFIDFARAEDPFCTTFNKPLKIKNGLFDISGCSNLQLNLGADRSSLINISAYVNHIGSLNGTDLKGAKNIVEIDLRLNNLHNISCQTFADQKKLVKLNLDSNKLKILNAGTFDPLVDLEELIISNNLLHIIEKDLFRCNKNLKRINLDQNPIFAINSNIFDGTIGNFNATFNNITCSNKNESCETVEDFKKYYKSCIDNYYDYFKDAKFSSECIIDVQTENNEDNFRKTLILLIAAVVSSFIPMILLLIHNFCKRSDSKCDAYNLSELQPYYSMNQENFHSEGQEDINDGLEENAGTSNFPIYAKVDKTKSDKGGLSLQTP